MRENTDLKKLPIWTLFTQCVHFKIALFTWNMEIHIHAWKQTFLIYTEKHLNKSHQNNFLRIDSKEIYL